MLYDKNIESTLKIIKTIKLDIAVLSLIKENC